MKGYHLLIALLLISALSCSKNKSETAKTTTTEQQRSAVSVDEANTQLIIAGQSYDTENLSAGGENVDAAKLAHDALMNGANVNIIDVDSSTPLVCISKTSDSAYFQKATFAAETLIAHRAEVNRKNTEKYSPLHYACANGNFALAALLVQHGADVNAIDKLNYTPIVYAMMGDYIEIFKLLKEHGADLSFKEPTDGKSLLELAQFRGSEKVATYLETLKR